MTHTLNWFVLLTRSNFEQTVYKSISKKRIEAFLPTIKRKSRRKDRQLMIDVPLFPGYIFVRSGSAPSDQLKILKTVGAVRLLGRPSGPLAVPEYQIESLKLTTSTQMDLITGTCERLAPGDPVMILQGPMAGFRGEFSRYKGKGRVIIRIDALGRYAGVEVDEDNIEKIPQLMS